MKAILWVIVLAILVATLATGCKQEPPPPPPATTRPASTLIACVPGYGNPQLHSIAAKLKTAFPSENTVDFGTGRHAYLLDPTAYVADNHHDRLVFVCHSYGCDSTKSAVTAMNRPIELLILIDPVPKQIFGTMTIPSNVKRCAVIWADQGILIRAKVKYPTAEFHVAGDHSEICHKAEALDIVEREIREVLK